MKYWKNQVSQASLNLFEQFLLLNLGVYSAPKTLSTWTINRQTWTAFSSHERNLSNGYSYCGGHNDLKCISIVVNNHWMTTSMPREGKTFVADTRLWKSSSWLQVSSVALRKAMDSSVVVEDDML
jgi:hypothetical protein